MESINEKQFLNLWLVKITLVSIKILFLFVIRNINHKKLGIKSNYPDAMRLRWTLNSIVIILNKFP